MEYFTGKDDSPTIEEYIKQTKSVWAKNWKDSVWLNFRDEAYEWYFSLETSNCPNFQIQNLKESF